MIYQECVPYYIEPPSPLTLGSRSQTQLLSFLLRATCPKRAIPVLYNRVCESLRLHPFNGSLDP